MANTDNTANETSNQAGASGSRKFPIAGGQDLPDSPKDEEKMKPETVIIDLPDVEDIPGQENIKPAPLGELADTTLSSDDEEGVGIFDDDDEEEDTVPITMGNDSDVSRSEKEGLRDADEDMPGGDDERLRQSKLDNEDDDGEPLNEEGFGADVTGKDLDVPGTDADDANEEIGEEDEENNQYSRGGNDTTEGTP